MKTIFRVIAKEKIEVGDVVSIEVNEAGYLFARTTSLIESEPSLGYKLKPIDVFSYGEKIAALGKTVERLGELAVDLSDFLKKFYGSQGENS